MTAIKEIYPELHDWIIAQPDNDWIRRDGEDQLYVSTGTALLPMYPPDDPLHGLKDFDVMNRWHKENVSVFIGIGLGHSLNRVVSQMEKGHHIVVIEPVGQIYRIAFDRYDFSEYIKNHTLFFAPTKDDADMIFGQLESFKVVEDWAIFIELITRTRQEYWKLADYIMEVLNQIQCNIGTVISAGAKIADNDIATLPYVIRHRGVSELINLFKDKPAICVSTGPSLERNIHLLKDIQDKVIIVAVGQALRPLLAYDIRPDFICTVDFGDVNMTHFAGLCDETVPLVTINKTYAPLLKAYKGSKFISAGVSPKFKDTAHKALADMGELAQGGSVAHMAFGLAAAMGCNPIMFIGQDLALSEKSHCSQVDSGGKIEIIDGNIKWKVDDPRSKTLHARDDIGMGSAQYVNGWWGSPVLTNTGLMTFITAMERLISQFVGTVLNCTEGGCHLEGAKRMFLIDAINKYCNEHIDKSALTPLLTLHPDADKRIEEAMPLLQNDISKLKDIITNAEKGLATDIKMRNVHNKNKLKRLLEQNAKYSVAAHELAKKLPTVELAIIGASRKIQSRLLNIEAAENKVIDNRDNLIIRIERNEIILKAAKDASKELLKTYQEAEKVLKQYMNEKPNSIALDSTGELKPPDLSDAEYYLSIGNFAKPLLEARRIENDIFYFTTDTKYKKIIEQALEMRNEKIALAEKELKTDLETKKNLIPQYLDLLAESRKYGKDNKDMDKALDILKKAIELLPDREEAQWGLASALFHLSKYEEAITAYINLIKLFPDNNRYLFEYGQVLLLAGRQQEGFNNIKNAMSKSSEFDHFLGALAKLYNENGLKEEAKEAAKIHLENYPHDKDIKDLLNSL